MMLLFCSICLNSVSDFCLLRNIAKPQRLLCASILIRTSKGRSFTGVQYSFCDAIVYCWHDNYEGNHPFSNKRGWNNYFIKNKTRIIAGSCGCYFALRKTRKLSFSFLYKVWVAIFEAITTITNGFLKTLSFFSFGLDLNPVITAWNN